MFAPTRSVLAAVLSIAGASGIAVSPAATADHPTRTANIELAGPAAPAIGALPYQVAVNQIASIVALAPIVVGSIEPCATCLPVTPQNPFTGYGALGIGVGVLSSPVAFVNTLFSTGNIATASGVALLAIQTPITNTFLQLVAPRGVGGFNIEGTITRALTAINDTVNGLLTITAQALLAGPIAVVGGLVSAAQLFATTLVATGNVVTAFNAGTTVVRNAVTSAVVDLVGAVQSTRAQVYSDLTNPPALAAVPDPTAAVAARKASRHSQAPTPRTASAKAGSAVKAPAAAAKRAVHAKSGADR